MRVDIINKRKKELGLTNEKLSQISGVPFGTLSKVMAGLIKNPKLGTLRAIADALGCTLDDFADAPESSKLEKAQVVQDEEFVITDLEKKLILRYREMPHMHDAINKLLGIEVARVETNKEEDK